MSILCLYIYLPRSLLTRRLIVVLTSYKSQSDLQGLDTVLHPDINLTIVIPLMNAGLNDRYLRPSTMIIPEHFIRRSDGQDAGIDSQLIPLVSQWPPFPIADRVIIQNHGLSGRRIARPSVPESMHVSKLHVLALKRYYTEIPYRR